ncbi:MAG: hypothetical protein Q7V01_07695, partial [Vicinamibacterales bacterium]|nr:hypothetical protein [Vicinamibacterales bacterium]
MTVTPAARPDGRMTVGYLTATLGGDAVQATWSGIIDAATDLDLNAICFAGQPVAGSGGAHAQANIAHALVSGSHLDGLLTDSSVIVPASSAPESRTFAEGWRPLPVVSVGSGGDVFPGEMSEELQREASSQLLYKVGYQGVKDLADLIGGTQDRVTPLIPEPVIAASGDARGDTTDALRARTLSGILLALLETIDVASLMDALAAGLPALGIASCYLSLYASPTPYRYPGPAPEWSRLMLAYRDHSRM